MATTIKLKNSVTTTNTPTSLAQGEVAINITDKKVWVGDAATTPIQLLGAGGSASFGALSCTSLTNSGLTSGRVTYATTAGLLTDSANLTFNGTTLTAAAITSTGAFAANGGATLGDASGDALTINSSAVSIPNGLNFDSNTLVIDATNNYVGVGMTPSNVFNVKPHANGYLRINQATTTAIQMQGINAAGTDYYPFLMGGSYTVLETGGAERMRIDSSGNVGIGTSSPTAGYKLSLSTGGIRISGTQATAGVTGAIDTQGYSMASGDYQYLNIFQANGLGGATVAQLYGAFIRCGTAASAYTTAEVSGIYIANHTKGAGSTVTYSYGIDIGDQTAGNNNFGLRSSVSSGSNKFNLYISGTADNHFAGNLLVGITSARANAGDVQVSKGISFPATQSAQSDANTLDDYEEGTWTPSLGGTATYTNQTGQYTKIGRMVNIRCNIEVLLLGTGSTSVISGLPFTSASTGNPNANASVGYFGSLAVSPVFISAFVGGAGTTITMTGLTAAGATASAGLAVFGNSARIDLTVTYFV